MSVDEALAQEDIVNNLINPDRLILSNTWQNKTRCKPAEWLWYCRIYPALCRVSAVLIAAFGVLIVLGEITLFLPYPIGLLPLVYKEDYGPVLT